MAQDSDNVIYKINFLDVMCFIRPILLAIGISKQHTINKLYVRFIKGKKVQ